MFDHPALEALKAQDEELHTIILEHWGFAPSLEEWVSEWLSVSEERFNEQHSWRAPDLRRAMEALRACF